MISRVPKLMRSKNISLTHNLNIKTDLILIKIETKRKTTLLNLKDFRIKITFEDQAVGSLISNDNLKFKLVMQIHSRRPPCKKGLVLIT